MTARIYDTCPHPRMGLRTLTQLTINTHKFSCRGVYDGLPALILGDDDLQRKI